MEAVNIGNRVVNSWLLRFDGGFVAVDTGYEGGCERYLKWLDKLGIAPENIKYIFVTHAHDDHVGFLGELWGATGAMLVMHEKAAERLREGQNRFIGGPSGVLAKIFVESMRLAGKGEHKFPPLDVACKADKTILWDGGRKIFREKGIDLEIVALPGHTADHIGLWDAESGRLFCGDAAMNGFPSIGRRIIWIEDGKDYLASWDAMIASGARTIVPSHGRPFDVADLVKNRANLEKIMKH